MNTLKRYDTIFIKIGTNLRNGKADDKSFISVAIFDHVTTQFGKENIGSLQNKVNYVVIDTKI